MLIQPIKFQNIIKPYNFVSVTNPKIQNYNLNPFPNDSVELSFTGIFEKSETSVYLEQALDSSQVHCPVCGVKMLSKNDYSELINKAGEVKNAGELVKLIKENEKYLNKRNQHFFSDVEEIPDYENLSVVEFRDEISKIAYKRKRKEIHNAENFMKNYMKDFSNEKQEKALEVIREIRTNQQYSTQKEKILKYIETLELNEQQSKEVKANTLKEVFLTDNYYRIFNPSKLSEMNEDDISKCIVQRLFSPSLSKINPISKYPAHENLENNKVLICSNCHANQSKYVFWKNNDLQDFKQNIKQYLTDIAYLMGNDEMTESKDYVKAFSSIMSKLTKSQIVFNRDEIESIENVRRLTQRHDRFSPIEQTDVDIPCAECGSVMLPHAKRKEIEKELLACSTPYEYSLVLKKNRKYIGVHYNTLAEIFLDVVKKSPEISNEEFIKKFKKFEGNYTKKALKNVLRHFENERGYYSKVATKEQLAIYDAFSYRLFKYVKQGKFNDLQLAPLYQECLHDLDLKNYPVKPIFMLLRDLKNIAYRHECLGQWNKSKYEDKDEVYTLLFNLFKYNVATADHLIPENKGGDGDKYNLIGLCKSCNRLKSQKDVNNWTIDNKYIASNMKKQLLVIDKMAKSGKITGYDDWAVNIANKMYEYTYGKIDLRAIFEKE